MASTKQMQERAKARKNAEKQANPKNASFLWFDETSCTVVAMEMPVIVPEPFRFEKDQALLALHIANTGNFENKNELCMMQVQNILSHYHGKLQCGKFYFLETAYVGSVFGPKTSGEISQADFDRKVAIAKELA